MGAAAPRAAHIVLCRNLAFTYFDDAHQRRVLDGIAARLPAGGFLVVGVHESLPDAAGFARIAERLPIYVRTQAPAAMTCENPPVTSGGAPPAPPGVRRATRPAAARSNAVRCRDLRPPARSFTPHIRAMGQPNYAHAPAASRRTMRRTRRRLTP